MQLIIQSILRLLYIIILLFSVQAWAQSKQEIVDKQLGTAIENNKQHEFLKSLEHSAQAFLLSKEIGYEKGIVDSKYEIAYSLHKLSRYDDSFRFINLILENHSAYLNNNLAMKMKVVELHGRNFYGQKMYAIAHEKFKELYDLTKKIKNPKTRAIEELNALTYLTLNLKDDQTPNLLHKAKTYNTKVTDKDKFVLLYINYSNYHSQVTHDLDSAIFYNNLAYDISSKGKSEWYFMALLQNARLKSKLRQFAESNKLAIQAQKLAIENNRGTELLNSYELLASNSEAIGDYKNQAAYLEQYSVKRDSIYKKLQNSAYVFLENMFKDINKKQEKLSRENNILFVSCLALLSISIFLLIQYLRSKKSRINKRLIIANQTHQLKTLTQKLKTVASDELTELAHTNSPDFLYKFTEAHSDFIEKLLKIEPNLHQSELTFCAYLKLNFTTKEIASFTFVSPKAVQNRKNRLRKKLLIPSDVDIYQWINAL